MFAAVMMPPVFGAGSGSPERLPMIPAFASSPFRPSRPSPLSSSPIRASSPTSSHMVSSQRDTQSSPIQSSSSSTATVQAQPSIFNFGGESSSITNNTTKGPAFRFASRPTKPVPRGQQSRDAAQQTRRTLFLKNVRQRADDRNWDRRNFEQELQKLEWWSLEREIRQAREADVMSMLTEQDIEDAADWMAASPSLSAQSSAMPSFFDDGDDDTADTSFASADHTRRHDGGGMYYDQAADEEDKEAMNERMADLLAMEEEAEVEALIASMEADNAASQPEPSVQMNESGHGQMTPPERPASAVYSDDEDYDAIFSELLSGEAEDMEMEL
ncbi:hypothetical protein Sste5346_000887 [Sporothrix stenoceras]|uniref:Uncharacterized protein n=1 Tax=Sporothrix stenoceras TaxID=5173 RepID=A0ABR3ZRD1_9PEZI